MEKIRPMLATTGTEDVLNREGYYFEAKLDGIRAFCYKKTKLKFTSRNGINITDAYPEFDFFGNIDAEECILDGEIIVYDEKGNPSFQLWSEHKESKTPATYVVFDILYYNGNSLLHEPLYVRKKILDNMIKENDNLQISFYTRKGRELWKFVKEKAIEGIIAKKDDSSYEVGARSQDWIKIKYTHDMDCVILGYTTEKRTLTSLALGLYKEGKLVYVGKVGTGFSENMIAELKHKLDAIKVENEIIETEKDVLPVEPILVCQVKYLLMTSNEKLRAPVFIRLREDKDPKDCNMPKE